jgi:MFS family permease
MPRLKHYKRIALPGLFSSMLCLAGLGFLAGNETLLLVEILTACAGFGIGTAFPVLNVAVQNAADRAQMGVVTGAMTFLRSLGAALGVALLGAVALSMGLPLAGEGQSSDHFAVESLSFGPIFLACSGLLLLALLILVLMPERPLRGREPPAALVE